MEHMSIVIQCTFSRKAQVGWYQTVSVLDFIGAKDDGGDDDNWSYKLCKAPVKS